MGCACGKPSAIDDSRDTAATPDTAAEAPAKLTSYSRRDDVVVEKKQGSGPIRVGHGVEVERRQRPRSNSGQLLQLRVVGGVPKGVEGEQVAAGWPAWLAAVAGEAIRGWVPRRADSFEKLDKVSSLYFFFVIVLKLHVALLQVEQ